MTTPLPFRMSEIRSITEMSRNNVIPVLVTTQIRRKDLNILLNGYQPTGSILGYPTLDTSIPRSLQK